MRIQKWTMLLIASLVCITLVTYAYVQQTTVKGKIGPAGSWIGAWIKTGPDTLWAISLSGEFEIAGVPAGTHQLFIDAAEPYRDTIIAVVVEGGEVKNVGEVLLNK